MTDEFYRQLLSEATIARCRPRLLRDNEWFLHATRVENYSSIQAHGLLAQRQLPAKSVMYDVASDEQKTAVLLRPALSKTDSSPCRGGDMFMIAVHRDALQHPLIPDWSFTHTPHEIDKLRAARPDLPIEDLVHDVIMATGMVMLLGNIPPQSLYVRTADQPDAEPRNWPSILVTAIDEVYKWNTGLTYEEIMKEDWDIA